MVIGRLGTNSEVLFFVNFEGVRNLILSIKVARGLQRWELFTNADALLYRISSGNAIHTFNHSNVFCFN